MDNPSSIKLSVKIDVKSQDCSFKIKTILTRIIKRITRLTQIMRLSGVKTAREGYSLIGA